MSPLILLFLLAGKRGPGYQNGTGLVDKNCFPLMIFSRKEYLSREIYNSQRQTDLNCPFSRQY